jgi:hypothetical protein
MAIVSHDKFNFESYIMNIIYLFFLQVKICGNKVLGESNFITIALKIATIKTNLTFIFKINMINDDHFAVN